MRAAYFEAFGGPEQVRVGDWDDPAPGGRDLLVRVHGAGIGYWDVKSVAGIFGSPRLPRIPGHEAAGVVLVAPEVSGFRSGDRVFTAADHAWAELVIAKPERTAGAPSGVDLPEAAGLVIAGTTAYQGLVEEGGLLAGQRVLITAASGGVGSLAVQIARHAGAEVFAVASTARFSLLAQLGAAHAFDYHDPGWIGQLRRLAPDGVDLLFEIAGGDAQTAALAAVREGGRAIFISTPPEALPASVTGGFFSSVATAERLERVAGLVAAGHLHPVQDSVLPLDEAARGLARVAGRHAVGKVSLRVG